MAERITIDPITRIEGHLRIDVEADNGKITNAWSSVQAFRGIETIMKGKDPRNGWAMTQRFCGVCTTTHALASIRAVEDALNVEIPVNAQMMRNLVLTIQALQDHIVHFYHLTALDWVDIVSALKADPIKAGQIAQSLSNWSSNSVNEMKDAKDRLAKFVGTGNLGIYGSGYWGHQDMRLSPEINLIGFAHYLQALEYQRKAAEAVAVIGGKNPHIQNLCIGGISTAIDMNSIAAMNMERVAWIRTLMMEVNRFVREVYIPDVLAIAGVYKDWFNKGTCTPNYMVAPEIPMDTKNTVFGMAGGMYIDGQFREIKTWKDETLRAGINENTSHSWFKNPKETLAPFEGEQIPDYTGFNADGKYSWCKAPRFEGKVAQVGPVADVIVGYMAKDPMIVKYTNVVMSALGIKLEQFNSTLGRNAARAIRALCMAEQAEVCMQKFLDNYASGDHTYVNYTNVPDGEYKGVGFEEAPRGMLSHWVIIDKKVFKNYQAVVPSTWLAGPRDDKGKMGPYEESLVTSPLINPEKPLEVLRSIHSFDPCIACAAHMVDPDGKEIVNIKVR